MPLQRRVRQVFSPDAGHLSFPRPAPPPPRPAPAPGPPMVAPVKLHSQTLDEALRSSRSDGPQRRAGADAILLQRPMPALDLAVALRVVRRRPGVRHATEPDERLEVVGDELRA